MEYKFFDKQFLVMPDDKGIIGKKVFYDDGIDTLISDVESGDSGKTGILKDIGNDASNDIFCVGDVVYGSLASWSLAYYDPNYDCKVAYSQGKQIQFKAEDGGWVDATEPHWYIDGEYRVKPEPMFEVIKQDGVYKIVKNSFMPNVFFGTAEECDAWIAEHTPKTRRMTNRELERWLAEGKGERVDVITKYVSSHYVYTEGYDNEKCDEDIRIRAWDENEWHEPLVEVKE